MNHSYRVRIVLALAEGCTSEDAEVSDDDLCEHYFLVGADSEDAAIEQALDEFHEDVFIGVLDNVVVTTGAELVHP